MNAMITKWGNSKGIRIPKPYLESLDLSENDIVDISINNNTIIIKKVLVGKTIEQRFEEFYKTDFETAIKENPYDFELLDWGKPEGEEIW